MSIFFMDVGPPLLSHSCEKKFLKSFARSEAFLKRWIKMSTNELILTVLSGAFFSKTYIDVP